MLMTRCRLGAQPQTARTSRVATPHCCHVARPRSVFPCRAQALGSRAVDKQAAPVDRSTLPLLFVQTVATICMVLTPQPAYSQERDIDTALNVPSELRADANDNPKALSQLMNSPNRREIEGCTRKCTSTCVRGGEGAPGLGPVSLRRDVVVFKEGFRSRSYCLSECAQVCSLAIDKAASPIAPPQPGADAAKK